MGEEQNTENLKRRRTPLIIIAILAVLALIACFAIPAAERYLAKKAAETNAAETNAAEMNAAEINAAETQIPAAEESVPPEDGSAASLYAQFDLSTVPEYDGEFVVKSFMHALSIRPT